MKIQSIEVENFRGFKKERLELSDYTCLVGANGAGKSTWISALNLFFHEPSAPIGVQGLSEEDFHLRNTSEPIKVTLTFSELTDAAQSDFKDYVRSGKLVVSTIVEWNSETKTPQVIQQGVRQVMSDFAVYFAKKADKEKVAVLKGVYQDIRKKYPELPTATTGKAMEEALRSYEEEHPELCELKPSNDQFYGVSKGKNRLERHLMWVFVPAVKDAQGEQAEGRATALGKLLGRTIRTKVDFSTAIDPLLDMIEKEYQRAVQERAEALNTLSSSLENRLRAWTHPGTELRLDWHYERGKTFQVQEPFAKASVGEGGFLGELGRLGHGVQRAFIVTLLQELAQGTSDSQPLMLLGIEEPELYQHPPQARHFAEELEHLASENSQVIVTTHSPYFVSTRGFESVRMVHRHKGKGTSRVFSCGFSDLSRRLSGALPGETHQRPSELMAAVGQILLPARNEMFFCTTPVFVEGTEDVAVISTTLKLLELWSQFRQYGCHFAVGDGKTNLSRMVAVSVELGFMPFLVFDGDCNQKKQSDVNRNRRDNGVLLRLLGHQQEPLPEAHLVLSDTVMWYSNITSVLKDDVGDDAWSRAAEAVRLKNQWGSNSVKRKNSMFVASMIEHLWNDGLRFPVLSKTCNAIIAHAKNVVSSRQ